MTSRKPDVTPVEMASAIRKVNLTLSVSGEGMEQVNVLVNALAHVTHKEDLEMASVIHALTEAYLAYNEMFRSAEDGEFYEGDDDD